MAGSTWKRWSWAAILLSTLALQPSSAVAGPSIEVGMTAAFPSPPYLTELLETAAQENATIYFPLLDRIAEGYFAEASSDRELYERFLLLLEQDSHISSQEALSTFKLALSLRSAAPRIEAHFQYYNTAVNGSGSGDQTEKDCEQWFLYEGNQYCSPSLKEGRAIVSNHQTQVRELPFDTRLGLGPDAILYADITSPKFGLFHRFLATKALAGEITYRLRHVRTSAGRVRGDELEQLPVNGYGVELVLKRTDYIVIDDREAAENPDNGSNTPKKLLSAADVTLDAEKEVSDLRALAKSELAELGMSTADYIMQSKTPFETLLKISQDFPRYSSSIAMHNASAEFIKEHRENRAIMVPSGANVLWMNGVQMIDRQIQPLSLVEDIRRERTMINGVRELGLTGKEVIELLGHAAISASKAEDASPRFDWRDEMEGGRVIVWLNNLEKDSRYKDFSKSLRRLLQVGMPGQIPQVRRDIFNQVYAVDLANPEDVLLIVEQLLEFVRRRLPIRFGLVPLAASPASAAQAKIVYHLLEAYGLSAVSTYLAESLSSRKLAAPDIKAFKAAIKDRELRDGATVLTLAEVLSDEKYEQQVEMARRWAHRLGANTAVAPIFVDGIVVPRDVNWMSTMSSKLGGHLRIIQEAVYYKRVNEDSWVPGHFLEKAVTRRNSYIFPDDSESLRFVNLHKLRTEHAALFNQVPVIEASGESTRGSWAVLTALVDPSSNDGLQLLHSAIQFRVKNPGIRLDIICNSKAVANSLDLNSQLKSSIKAATGATSWEALKALLTTEELATSDYITALATFQDSVGIQPETNVLILNGRVLDPIDKAESFGEDDFAAFLEWEQAERILPVYAAVDDLKLTSKLTSPLDAAKLTSITALSTVSDVPEGIFESASTLRISSFNKWNTAHTSFEVGNLNTATIHFNAVLDPASEIGQRWAPILSVLSRLDGVYLRVFLNPRERLDDLPVKRFYRSVIEPTPQFDDYGKVKALGAKFNGLPTEALLNLGMEVPPAWLVAPKVSVHDLDNIKLSSIKSDVEATYELEHILIEGHSQEAGGQPPRGAQLILGTENNNHFADTIVMANLGYFQFKANPGYYNLRLKDGRSSEIYSLESVGSSGMSPTPGDNFTDVALMDFQGTTLYPRLVRKPGMEREEILNEEGAPTDAAAQTKGAMDFVAKGIKFAEGILGKSKSNAGADANKGLEVAGKQQADINIFSVASGHLYERMLNIMMVSVMRHTNHTVKFWFIEQFLSPSFKDFIPTLAEAYGFQYEMVTYKWPHWLRQQKEKQREIWGYKILFLDVLFPLSLDKVIFVDADQIVRTDMYDLVQLDLHGAPYGFTPMCDSRTEMEGFRFWKQGYWNNYLRGQPYHISALYVVDLRRFRELAAGDRLRQTYHSLSADPQSLANLDQDLPNHMQFQIPIFSLPQDWLWCETWCSDEALTTAKTIDLCNNPQTKEPKLDRARRQVPEWTVYDSEIAALDKRRRTGGSLSQEKGDAAVAPTPIRVGGESKGQQKPLVGKAAGESGQGQRNMAHVRDEL
ncbi:killer toxin resistant protein [Sporothrix epigloea]|uniref:Killer toxin resistant protein n=1 Tax=Sporothrix epigloea TaxID=1892477 RepID=A0ABP0E1L1_9PEZI